jgi:hypothetical protein
VKTYTFDEQLRLGKLGEAELDAHFAATYAIEPASRFEERHGIDRWFTRNWKTFGVEFKTDFLTHRTGNAFVECVSVARDGAAPRPGWVYSTAADLVVYYARGYGEALLLTPDALRAALAGRWARYPERACQNPGYRSQGRLVPWVELRRLAKSSAKISPLTSSAGRAILAESGGGGTATAPGGRPGRASDVPVVHLATTAPS